MGFQLGGTTVVSDAEGIRADDIGEQGYILGPDPGTGGAAVMPCGRVHMAYGPSGSGKSTILFQMLIAMQEGRDFLGYPTQWHPTVYIAFDREEEETHETMRRIGLEPASIPQFYPEVSLPDAKRTIDDRLEQVVGAVMAKWPEAKILLFDAFFILAAHGQINNYLFMAEWLQRARKLCKKLGVTIIGVVHSPKQREGDKITNPRQVMQGSVAGGGFTSCGLMIETPADEKRIVYVLPRNSPDQKFEMMVDDRGRLVPDKKTHADRLDVLEHYFKGLPRGGSRATADILAYMKKLGISRSTIMRYINQLVDDGRLVQVGHGGYGPGPLMYTGVVETQAAAVDVTPWAEVKG